MGGLGDFTLYTNVEEPQLLLRLGTIVQGFRAAYSGRYGVDPEGSAEEAIVLFRSEREYRSFESEVTGIRGLETLGHSSQGLLVTFVGLRDSDEVLRVFVHELTHIMNRRLYYAHSTFLVRFLLVGRAGKGAEVLLAFLSGISAGTSADSQGLLRLLEGENGVDIDNELFFWLRHQAQSSRVPLP